MKENIPKIHHLGEEAKIFSQLETQLKTRFNNKDILAAAYSLCQKIEKDAAYYDAIVSDEISGRQFSLLVKNVMDNLRAKENKRPIKLFFLLGGHNLSAPVASGLILFLDGHKSDLRKTLIVTEYISSGDSIKKMSRIFGENGIFPDIATLSIARAPEFYNEKFSNKLIYGAIGDRGQIFWSAGKAHQPSGVVAGSNPDGSIRSAYPIRYKAYRPAMAEETQRQVNQSRSEIKFISGVFTELLDKGVKLEIEENEVESSEVDFFLASFGGVMNELSKKEENNKKKEAIKKVPFDIYFYRHSNKGDDGNLNDIGVAKAGAFKTDVPEGAEVEIFTSDVPRAIDTGRLVGKKFNNLVPTRAPILSEEPYNEKYIEELGLSGLKWLVDNKVSKLLAGKIARFTLNQIENPDRKPNIIAITHVPPIMAFLGYVLANSKGKNFIDQEVQFELFKSYGGKLTEHDRSTEPAFVDYLEGFKINYDPQRKGLLEISFRNHHIQIPISLLKKLAGQLAQKKNVSSPYSGIGYIEMV